MCFEFHLPKIFATSPSNSCAVSACTILWRPFQGKAYLVAYSLFWAPTGFQNVFRSCSIKFPSFLIRICSKTLAPSVMKTHYSSGKLKCWHKCCLDKDILLHLMSKFSFLFLRTSLKLEPAAWLVHSSIVCAQASTWTILKTCQFKCVDFRLKYYSMTLVFWPQDRSVCVSVSPRPGRVLRRWMDDVGVPAE